MTFVFHYNLKLKLQFSDPYIFSTRWRRTHLKRLSLDNCSVPLQTFRSFFMFLSRHLVEQVLGRVAIRWIMYVRVYVCMYVLGGVGIMWSRYYVEQALGVLGIRCSRYQVEWVLGGIGIMWSSFQVKQALGGIGINELGLPPEFKLTTSPPPLHQLDRFCGN